MNQGAESLDRTLCHPESYDLARYLLREMKWDLDDKASLGTIPCRKDRATAWKTVVESASKKFDVTNDRVFLVLDNLATSILNPDPRLREGATTNGASAGPVETELDFQTLPSELVPLKALRKACPVRNIQAVVRNVLDFGIFVDFGGDSDGLLHRSKLGSRYLNDFMIGQTVGVDILGVSSSNRVSVALAGFSYPAESLEDSKKRPVTKENRAGLSKKRKRGTT